MNNSTKKQTMQKNTSSRSANTSGGGKLKEASGSRPQETGEPENITSSSNIPFIPIIRQADNMKTLPKYATILARNADDGVNMDDLDQLQLDLENLISTCAVRNRYFRAEIESIDRVEEKRDRKGKCYDKGSLKRKKQDEKLKYKDVKNGASRPVKKHYRLPINSILGDPQIRQENPKINLPKNETSDKFWASVEPYCAPISSAHAMFLDKLIEECGQEIDLKIPDLGDYYANEWNETVTNVEQEMGLGVKTPGQDLKKNGLNVMIDTFSTPTTQRLFAALIEERVMTSFPGVTASDLNIIKTGTGNRDALCMDRRLKKNLVEQGILTLEDISQNTPEDEILQEIKKCQQELATVNEYNVEELNRLKSIVVKDLKKQELKMQLEKVDNQILDLYNRVLITKQKQIKETAATATSIGEDLDRKSEYTKIFRDFEMQTDSLLKQQTKLQKDIKELSSEET